MKLLSFKKKKPSPYVFYAFLISADVEYFSMAIIGIMEMNLENR